MFFMQAARPERIREIFRLIEDKTVEYCLFPEVLSEIRDVLTRPKHQLRFPQLTAAQIAEFLEDVTLRSRFIENVPERYVLERDPKDSKYVNLAVEAEARCIVTRDNDLLALMNPNLAIGRDFGRRFPRLRVLDPTLSYASLQHPKVEIPSSWKGGNCLRHILTLRPVRADS